jgi:hypothetical protein
MPIDRHRGQWRVRFTAENKTYEIGHFDSKAEALEESYYHMSRSEIAIELGITRQAVDKAERSALKKIRKSPLAMRLLREYLD